MNRNILSCLSFESKEIFSLLLHKGALTKGDLTELSGLKLTSLNRMMQPLEELGLIVKAEIGESTGGRKPVLYDVNSGKYYLVGIDISRIYTQVVLTNLKMELVEKYRFDMNKESTPQATLKLIWTWIEDVFEKLKKKDGVVVGIGIGTVGPLDRSNGVVLNPENFEAEGWENVHLKSIFQDRLGVPVVIDNGANAAVLAETYFGIGKGIRNVIYINCGIGIRTGVISSGIFVRNINDGEDAFAHMVVDVNGEKCRCGNLGCIERYASIYSITEKFMADFNKESTSLKQKPVEQVSYTDICKAAEVNEPTARQVILKAAVIMGNGLGNLIKLLDPEIVILSGQLIKHSKLFYQKCIETALEKIHMNSERKIIFSRGGYFNENAISIGSAAMVLENFLDNGGLN